MRDENRLRNIIRDFFAYYNNPKAETRAMDVVALLLIKHSRRCQESDKELLASVMKDYDLLARVDQLYLKTLNEMMEEFCQVERENYGYFTWNSLVAVFTAAHCVLMKYPHLYIDISDMLCHICLASATDLQQLGGGWNNFIANYSYVLLAEQ